MVQTMNSRNTYLNFDIGIVSVCVCVCVLAILLKLWEPKYVTMTNVKL